jgi:hypothetical protein
MRVLLAFDDSVHEISKCIKILQRYDAKATFFLDTNRLNARIQETICQLPQNCEIASHTLAHRRLDKLDYTDLQYEISESKKILEATFKKQVLAFAYPFGIYEARAVNFLEDAGYLFARTTEPFSLGINFSDPYRVKVLMTDYYPSYRNILCNLNNKMVNWVLELKLKGINPYVMIKKTIRETIQSLKQGRNFNETVTLVFHPRQIEETSSWEIFVEIVEELSFNCQLITFADVNTEFKKTKSYGNRNN